MAATNASKNDMNVVAPVSDAQRSTSANATSSRPTSPHRSRAHRGRLAGLGIGLAGVLAATAVSAGAAVVPAQAPTATSSTNSAAPARPTAGASNDSGAVSDAFVGNVAAAHVSDGVAASANDALSVSLSGPDGPWLVAPEGKQNVTTALFDPVTRWAPGNESKPGNAFDADYAPLYFKVNATCSPMEGDVSLRLMGDAAKWFGDSVSIDDKSWTVGQQTPDGLVAHIHLPSVSAGQVVPVYYKASMPWEDPNQAMNLSAFAEVDFGVDSTDPACGTAVTNPPAGPSGPGLVSELTPNPNPGLGSNGANVHTGGTDAGSNLLVKVAGALVVAGVALAVIAGFRRRKKDDEATDVSGGESS